MSVIDLVDCILEIARSNQKPTTVTHEIPSISLSCDKARGILDWEPRRSFESELVLQWFRAAAAVASKVMLGVHVAGEFAIWRDGHRASRHPKVDGATVTIAAQP
jgi:hypothetical protein